MNTTTSQRSRAKGIVATRAHKMKTRAMFESKGKANLPPETLQTLDLGQVLKALEPCQRMLGGLAATNVGKVTAACESVLPALFAGAKIPGQRSLAVGGIDMVVVLLHRLSSALGRAVSKGKEHPLRDDAAFIRDLRISIRRAVRKQGILLRV